MKNIFVVPLLVLALTFGSKAQTAQWDKLELSFTSERTYENPLYELDEFYALFTSPTGKTRKINGFWDGDKNFKIRFSPDEQGIDRKSTRLNSSHVKISYAV